MLLLRHYLRNDYRACAHFSGVKSHQGLIFSQESRIIYVPFLRPVHDLPIEKLREAIMFADLHPEVDGIAFPLYDMWDETHYRDDEHWNAHMRPWVMCVKYDPEREYVWRETPLHCGRFPLNASTNAVMVEGMAIQHWGWAKPEDREAKYKRYMAADPEGKSGNMNQYESILDAEPSIKEFIL